MDSPSAARSTGCVADFFILRLGFLGLALAAAKTVWSIPQDNNPGVAAVALAMGRHNAPANVSPQTRERI